MRKCRKCDKSVQFTQKREIKYVLRLCISRSNLVVFVGILTYNYYLINTADFANVYYKNKTSVV